MNHKTESFERLRSETRSDSKKPKKKKELERVKQWRFEFRLGNCSSTVGGPSRFSRSASLSSTLPLSKSSVKCFFVILLLILVSRSCDSILANSELRRLALVMIWDFLFWLWCGWVGEKIEEIERSWSSSDLDFFFFFLCLIVCGNMWKAQVFILLLDLFLFSKSLDIRFSCSVTRVSNVYLPFLIVCDSVHSFSLV